MKSLVKSFYTNIACPESFIIIACYSLSLLTISAFYFTHCNIINLSLFIALSLFFGWKAESKTIKPIFIIGAFIVFFLVMYTNIYFAGILASLWMFILSWNSGRKSKWVLSHFASAILMFFVVEIFLLKNALIEVYLQDFSHSYSSLVRNTFGRGGIVGSELLNIRFVVFSLICVFPFSENKKNIDILIPVLCQSFFLFISVLLFILNFHWLGISITFIATFLLLTTNSNRYNIPKDKSKCFKDLIFLRLTRAVGILYLIVFIVFCGSYIHNRMAGFAENGRKILFINDNLGTEGGRRDITNFEKPPQKILIDDFNDMIQSARYNTLVNKLLPGMGYQVDIKSVSQLTVKDIQKSDLVVAICLQNILSDKIKGELLNSVRKGKNLLVLGDHTDIWKVQKPFNDLLGGLGILLNYDSAYPFGSWYGQMTFCQHPIHYNKWFPNTKFDIGYSVGASLDINNLVVRPMIVTSDGFADLGTPNAPNIAGLGDQMYTENELRGGSVLAAERNYGLGKVIAFGDTAFLQNISTTRNFGYLASLFDYMTMPIKWRWYSSHWFYWLSLACSVVIVGSLFYRFSSGYSILCILSVVIPCLIYGLIAKDISVINNMSSKVILVDNCHGEKFGNTGSDNSISTFINLLNVVTEDIILVTDAIKALDCETVDGLVLLAPRGAITNRDSKNIVKFISSGGKVLYASGYYESLFCRNWLKELGCEILPVPLGSGQDLELINKVYHKVPDIVETWELNLNDNWNSILECFGKTILADCKYAKGRLMVLSDSYLMFDTNFKREYGMSHNNFAFFSSLFTDLFGNTMSHQQISTKIDDN